MMKITTTGSIVLALLLAAAVQVGVADGASQKTEMESIYISSFVMEPEVLYPYEEGTVSVTVSNSGNTSIGVSNPDIVSDDIHVTKKDTWHTVSYLVSGSSITYDFVVSADPPDGDGSYFAMFTIQTVNGAAVHYPFTIQIDSDDITATVSKKPDAFPLSAEKTVNLTIINPRAGAIDNVIVTAEGSGVEVNPSHKYVGTLEAHSSADVSFAVTARQESELVFNISYQNGESDHYKKIILPIPVGNDKTAAVPVINNLAFTSQGTTSDLSGDITNTGVSDAKGLVVTVASPAKGTGTYPEYAVGSLASDDSSSFEITFTCTDLSAVPLVIRWKDTDGNDYSVTKILDLTSYSGSGGMGMPSGSNSTTGTSRASGNSGMQGGPGGSMGGMGGPGGSMSGPGATSSSGSVISSITNPKGGLASFYPVIAMFVLIIAGAVVYTKRKWILSKVKKQ